MGLCNELGTLWARADGVKKKPSNGSMSLGAMDKIYWLFGLVTYSWTLTRD